jgi:DNA invertase Pin-like site-specific DNA recombinase
MVKYIGYIRQSQTHEGTISPDEQRIEIEHWAARPSHEVEIVWLPPDLDWSGKSLDRPSMEKALALLRDGKAEGIVVSKLDRLTRSVGDLSRLIEEMRESTWHIICLDMGGETIDFRTRTGKLMGYMVAMFAEWYRDGTVEEWERHRRHKIFEEGAHWGQVPLGYRRGITTNSAGQEKPGPLVIDEEWAPVVRQAFRRRARGETWAQIAKYLTVQGAPNALARAEAKKSGGNAVGSEWTAAGARSIIVNRVYLGEARAGEFMKTGAHPALVDVGQWRKANRAKGAFPERKRAKTALLGGEGGRGNGGILRCGTCGKTLSHSTSGRTDAKKYFHYRCNNLVCSSRANISAPRVEAYLIEKAIEMSRAFRNASAPVEVEEDATNLEARLAKLEEERDSLESARAAGEVHGAIYWKEASRIEAEIETVAAALERVTVEESQDWRSVAPDDLKAHLFEDVDGRLIARDIHAARMFLRQMLGVATVYPQAGISAGIKDVADRVTINGPKANA